MERERCPYCGQTRFTTDNYGETRRIQVPGGGSPVHFGCLLHWLIDDALRRNFPGITRREIKVLRRRMGAPEPKFPYLEPLHEVGKEMGWTRGMRASQVQRSAVLRLSRAVRAARVQQENEELLESAVAEAIDAAKEFVSVAEKMTP